MSIMPQKNSKRKKLTERVDEFDVASEGERNVRHDPQVFGWGHWMEVPFSDMGILKSEDVWGGRVLQAGRREQGQELSFRHVEVDVTVRM